jgi:hypothetical protein
MTQAGERLHALDAVRAVMMLLGLVIHVACSYTVVPLPAWPYQDAAATPLADSLLRGIHVFRMPVFFVMAGLFSALLLGKRGEVGLMKNRGLRIGVPFIVGWLILYPLLISGFRWSLAAKTDGFSAGGEAARSYFADGPLYADSTAHLWFLVFGITGLFLRYMDRPMPKVRYLVDASYWIYLVHLPFTTWTPGLMSGLDWPGEVKMLALLLLITPPILLSYHYLVRGTLIGVVLNGRRYERIWPFGSDKHRIVEPAPQPIVTDTP